RAEDIFGMPADRMQGRTSLDPQWNTIHEDGTPFPGETHPSMVALTTNKPQSNVVMGLCWPDGRVKWISINARPIDPLGTGVPTGVVCSCSDITERREQEEAVRASQQRLKALVHNVSDVIAVHDADGNFIFRTSSASRILGYPEEEFDRMTLEQLVHPEDYPLLEAHFEEW